MLFHALVLTDAHLDIDFRAKNSVRFNGKCTVCCFLTFNICSLPKCLFWV